MKSISIAKKRDQHSNDDCKYDNHPSHIRILMRKVMDLCVNVQYDILYDKSSNKVIFDLLA